MGSNPAQGIKSFSFNENVIQKVVRPWPPITSLSTVIYMNGVIKSLYLLRQCDVDNLVNCAIKSLYLLRQCDVDNLVNKQF